MLKAPQAIEKRALAKCHGGTGEVQAALLLDSKDGVPGVRFMHDDVLAPGVSIGEHPHKDPEIYYVVEGEGTLLWDGQRVPVSGGHLSVVQPGHSHGLENTGSRPLRLIVVGLA